MSFSRYDEDGARNQLPYALLHRSSPRYALRHGMTRTKHVFQQNPWNLSIGKSHSYCNRHTWQVPDRRVVNTTASQGSCRGHNHHAEVTNFCAMISTLLDRNDIYCPKKKEDRNIWKKKHKERLTVLFKSRVKYVKIFLTNLIFISNTVKYILVPMAHCCK